MARKKEEDNTEKCVICKEPINFGYLCEETGEMFCSKKCVEKSMNACTAHEDWHWDEGENRLGGLASELIGGYWVPLRLIRIKATQI